MQLKPEKIAQAADPEIWTTSMAIFFKSKLEALALLAILEHSEYLKQILF